MIEKRETSLTDQSVWVRSDFENSEEWIVRLTSDDIAELSDAVAMVKQRGLSVPDISKEDFALPRFGAVLQDVSDELENGRGFVLLRGIPVDDYAPDDLRILYWGIGIHLGEVISQNGRGDLIGHVTDLGFDWSQPNVRGYTTNAGLRPHNDSADLVGLLCVHPAQQGGESIIASATAIFNSILRDAPECLDALYDGFHYDVRGEGVTGKMTEVTRNRVPVYSYHKGRMSCRYNAKAIETAADKMGEPLAQMQRTALRLIEDRFNDPACHLKMVLQPGDLQLLNNFVVLHSRTPYEDAGPPAAKRLLLRLWINLWEGRELAPDFADRYNAGARRGVPARASAP